MENVLLIGGNGYIGQEVLRQWMELDTQTHFYIVSRTGNSKIQNERVHNIVADFTQIDPVLVGLPENIHCIINFIGRPEKDIAQLDKVNKVPVENMIKLAEKFKVYSLGFIGGLLGPKSFIKIKADLIQKLKNTDKNISYVEPTIVYGGGRNDSLAKLIPVFKVLGLFIKNMKPMELNQVANELVQKLISK